MKKKTVVTVRFGILLLCAVLFFGIGMWAAGRMSPQAGITDDLISSRIEEISELAVTEYHYTRVGKYEDRLDFYGWKVPLTLKQFIISYDGTIRAGVDLSSAAAEVTGNEVRIKLPAPEILSHEVDSDSITIFDETKNIFNPIRITDYVEFSKDQQAAAEQEALDKGLLSEAQERAETVIRQWVAALYADAGGDASAEVIVEFANIK